MGIERDLSKLSKEKIKEIAGEKDLMPAMVEGTEDVIQISNKDTEGVKEIDWETFFEIMNEKNLSVYSTDGGWMKIMRDKEKK